MVPQYDCTGVLPDGTTHTFRVGQELIGVRFRQITLRMSFEQLHDPNVLQWMSHVKCRVTNLSVPLTIEVL